MNQAYFSFYLCLLFSPNMNQTYSSLDLCLLFNPTMNQSYSVFVSLFIVKSNHEPTLLRLYISVYCWVRPWTNPTPSFYPYLLLSPTMNRPYSVYQPYSVFLSLFTVKSCHEPTLFRLLSLFNFNFDHEPTNPNLPYISVNCLVRPWTNPTTSLYLCLLFSPNMNQPYSSLYLC